MFIRRNHQYAHRHEVETRQTYIYGLRTIILLRPDTDQRGKRFRLARVLRHGQGEHREKYTVLYLSSVHDYETYTSDRNLDGSDMFRVVWEQSVQDIVHMNGHDTRISDKSEVLVRYWVGRWREAYGGEALDEEEVANNQVILSLT